MPACLIPRPCEAFSSFVPHTDQAETQQNKDFSEIIGIERSGALGKECRLWATWFLTDSGGWNELQWGWQARFPYPARKRCGMQSWRASIRRFQPSCKPLGLKQYSITRTESCRPVRPSHTHQRFHDYVGARYARFQGPSGDRLEATWSSHTERRDL